MGKKVVLDDSIIEYTSHVTLMEVIKICDEIATRARENPGHWSEGIELGALRCRDAVRRYEVQTWGDGT